MRNTQLSNPPTRPEAAGAAAAPADNRITGSDASLINAQMQHRNAMWASDVQGLREGPLAMRALYNRLTKILLEYVNSRIQLCNCSPYNVTLANVVRNPNVPQKFQYVSRDSRNNERLYETSWHYTCIERNQPLTTARLRVIFDALRQLSELAPELERVPLEQAARNQMLEAFANILNPALLAIRRQHGEYATSHHVHVSGSRIPFFGIGSGTLFQSGAENTLLAGLKAIDNVRNTSQEIFQKHHNEMNVFLEFGRQLHLGT